MPNNPEPLYGSIPYITGIDQTFSSGVAWMNSAHTWVEIASTEDGFKNSGWMSESGSLEFFVFASAFDNGQFNRFKKV
jgi:hypothetical protein